jgi:hypothetical protein
MEWCATPASWHVRRQGFLAAQIAIRHRRRRCEGFWRSHLEASRRFIDDCVAVEAGGRREHAVVLGSGHLNDISARFLDRAFRRITLVDVVHPIEVRLRCMVSRGRWRCVSTDLSDPEQQVVELVHNASWVFSTCLLSQLPLNHVEALAFNILDRHLELLRSARRSVLVTDTSKRFSAEEKWVGLLGGIKLPEPRKSWIWQLAPPGEHGNPGRGCEERLVEASVLGV